MNLSPSWVPFLRSAGIDAVHWSGVGAPNAPDTELMEWARDNDAIVFTNDLDFSALLAATRGVGPSVVQTRMQNLLPSAIGSVILNVLVEHADQLHVGALVTVDNRGSRIRILPLKTD